MTTQGLYGKEVYSPYAQLKRDLRGVKKLTDEQIMRNSALRAKNDVEKSPSGRIYKALPAIMITTLAGIAAASRPGKLSTRVKAGAETLGIFAAGSLVLKGFDKVVNKIEQSKNSEKKDKMNPFLKAALGIAGSVGVLYLGFAGIKKGKTEFVEKVKPALVKKFPKIAENTVNFKNDIVGAINTSWLGKKVGNSQRVISKNAFPAAILGYFVSAIGLGASLNKKMGKEYVNNVNDMTMMRTEADVALKLMKQYEKHTPKSDPECDALCQEAKLAQEEI